MGVSGGPLSRVCGGRSVWRLASLLGGRVLHRSPSPPIDGPARGRSLARRAGDLRLFRLSADPDPAEARDLHLPVHRADHFPLGRILFRQEEETPLPVPRGDSRLGEHASHLPDGLPVVRRLSRRWTGAGRLETGVPVGAPSYLGLPSRRGRNRRTSPLRAEPAWVRSNPYPPPRNLTRRVRGGKFHPDVDLGTDSGEGDRVLRVLSGSGNHCGGVPPAGHFRQEDLPPRSVPVLHCVQRGMGLRTRRFHDGAVPFPRNLPAPDRIRRTNGGMVRAESATEGKTFVGKRKGPKEEVQACGKEKRAGTAYPVLRPAGCP